MTELLLLYLFRYTIILLGIGCYLTGDSLTGSILLVLSLVAAIRATYIIRNEYEGD